MDKKRKVTLVCFLAIALIALFVVFFIFKKASSTKQTNETANQKQSTSSSSQTAQTSQSKNDNKPEEATLIATFTKSNSWESSGKKYAQFDMSVNNKGDKAVSEWTIDVETVDGASIDNSWNCSINISSENGKSIIKISPVDFNKRIEKSSSTQGIGFILSTSSDVDLKTYEIAAKTEDGASIIAKSTGEESKEGGQEEAKDQVAKEDAQPASEGNSGDNSSNSSSSPSYSSNNVNPSGMLHVDGTSLVDANGNPVQLRGVSTHGISWFPQYVNQDAFATIKNDWGANVVRLAMYPAEYNGYLTGGDQSGLKSTIFDGVDYATNLGMYVLIDWHVLNYNPQQYQDQAIDFFSEMASKYKDNPYVIYEICNEPVGADYASNIKPYAESVISAIRSAGSSQLVIVGTNTWSQDVDAVVGNKIDDPNVMYTLHFYAGTHKDNIRNKLTTALDGGVPVFVTECSICDASGNGGIDYDSASAWLDLLNSRGVSFIAWSLCNKDETSALINSSSSSLSSWSDSELSDTGRWFKSAISGN